MYTHPHLFYHNIALPLILEKVPKAEIDKKVKEVLRFVELEDKKDVYVSQLSGGQKQRISIARALSKHSPILVMDDSTSALDMETEHEIQKTLNSLKDTTKIIIAHRISAVCHADEIIYLQDGRIAERGTHEELLAKKGLYYDTYMAQYGGYLAS